MLGLLVVEASSVGVEALKWGLCEPLLQVSNSGISRKEA